MFKCEIIAHSKDVVSGKEIITLAATFPTCILQEMNTHGRLSRNSSSSRAISFIKYVDMVETSPYMPEWTQEQKGMAGTVITDAARIDLLNEVWLGARDAAVSDARHLYLRGAHKQDCNQLLRPFGWTTQLITATEWANFFHQRTTDFCHPAMKRIARLMYEAIERSTNPKILKRGEWHCPFETGDSKTLLASAARCAWVSYTNHGKQATELEAIEFAQNLMKNAHWSPFQHQARNDGASAIPSNFIGWTQFRKLLPNEEVKEFTKTW